MSGGKAHHCRRYAMRLVWEDWVVRGDLRERISRRVPFCVTCGRERPLRVPRRVQMVEVEAAHPVAGALLTLEGRTVAVELARRAFRKGKSVGARGLFSALEAKGLPRSVVEDQLDTLLRCGWVGFSYRVQGTRRELFRVQVLDPPAVEEAGKPGLREARREARRKAGEILEGIEHPVAEEVRRMLSAEPDLDPGMIEVLAAVAAHAATGEVLSERVFAVRWLGDSKALARRRRGVERRLGPLPRLGIREGAAVTLVGGRGRIMLEGAELDLASLGPFIGLSREALLGIRSVDLPADGLLVVENFAPFAACARGEVPGVGRALVVWSGGYPGRGVRSLVEAAAAAGETIRVWADLDLDGVRIARLIARWVPVLPVGMSPTDLERAPVRRRLTRRFGAAIRADLEARPGALLAETLKAILAAGEWAEQEVFLGPPPPGEESTLFLVPPPGPRVQ